MRAILLPLLAIATMSVSAIAKPPAPPNEPAPPKASVPPIASAPSANAEGKEALKDTPKSLPKVMHPCKGEIPVLNPEACAGTVDIKEEVRQARCRQMITEVREKTQQSYTKPKTSSAQQNLVEVIKPKLDNADGKKAKMLWAIDRQIEGCSMMTVMGDKDNLQPYPEPSGEVKMQQIIVDQKAKPAKSH